MARKTFTVMDRCGGIDMPDGTHYPSRGGHVEVDNPHHADMIGRSFEKGMGYVEGKLVIFSGAEGKRCPTCAFHAFIWQDTCPRCNDSFTVPAASEELEAHS